MHQQTYRASSLPRSRISVCLQSRSVGHVKGSASLARICHALPATARRQGISTPASSRGSTTLSTVDIDSPFTLQNFSIEAYRRNGFVKIPKVFDEPTLAHFGPAMSLEVAEADKTPLQQDPDYQQAFTQVSATVNVIDSAIPCTALHSSAQLCTAHSVKLPWQALSLDSLTLTADVRSCCRLTGAESVAKE